MKRILLVDDKEIVELKIAKDYYRKDEPQLLNELKSNRNQSRDARQFWKRESRIQALHLLRNLCLIRATNLQHCVFFAKFLTKGSGN